MRKGLSDMGYDTGPSETPIVPLIIGGIKKTMNFFMDLYNHKPVGIFTNPVMAPATQEGRELVRTSYMATMTDEVLDQALEIFEKVGKKAKII